MGTQPCSSTTDHTKAILPSRSKRRDRFCRNRGALHSGRHSRHPDLSAWTCHPDLVIKIQRVDAYCMPTGASTDRPAISMDCSSVTPALGDPQSPGAAEVFYGLLKRLQDQGNLSEAAKVSYTWPRHMADQPLSTQANFQLVTVAGNLANTCVSTSCGAAT